MSLFKKNLILVIVAVIIVIVPLVIYSNGSAEFAGADGQAEEAISEIDPNYEPWFDGGIELPSGEVESLLFCVQAAVGSGIICFILGRMTAKPKNRDNRDYHENKKEKSDRKNKQG